MQSIGLRCYVEKQSYNSEEDELSLQEKSWKS